MLRVVKNFAKALKVVQGHCKWYHSKAWVRFYIRIHSIVTMAAPLALAVWLSGKALASINVVELRQIRLVLGWVTVCGRVNHFGM